MICAFVAAFGGLQAEGFGKPYVPPKRTLPHCDEPHRGPCYRRKYDVMENNDEEMDDIGVTRSWNPQFPRDRPVFHPYDEEMEDIDQVGLPVSYPPMIQCKGRCHRSYLHCLSMCGSYQLSRSDDYKRKARRCQQNKSSCISRKCYNEWK